MLDSKRAGETDDMSGKDPVRSVETRDAADCLF